MKKDRNAVAMANKRWAGKSAAERREHAMKMVKARQSRQRDESVRVDLGSPIEQDAKTLQNARERE